MKLVGAHRGLAEQVPAAGSGETLNTGLETADRDRACRREQTGVLSPRYLE